MKKRIVIVGGGAAGMFCAANLNEQLYEVIILEQNSDVLQKVKISGGGRCNVSHACFDPRDLVKFYPRGHKELLSVFSRFQPGDTMAWFEARKVELKIEVDNRIFPESNSSQTIINALLKELEHKADIKTKTTVLDICRTEHAYLIRTSRGDFEADAVVYTTGSSPKSLKILEKLGHNTVEQVPSLFTFNIQDELFKDLPGTSFENAEVAIAHLKAAESGPLLITHWGLSGPAVLKLSAWKARELFEMGYRFEISVNFISQSPVEALRALTDFKNANPKKAVAQSKIFNITNRFWNKILSACGIHPEKPVSHLSKKEMLAAVNLLCKKKLAVSGKSTFKDEFVTAGGVDLKEINFKNMSSRKLPDFYIAGEVLNIDAVTGGFNFQACWSEGWLIAEDLNSKMLQ